MAEGPRAGRLVQDVARVFSGQLVTTGIGIVTGVITARALGAHDRGLFQLLVLLPVTLGNFVKLGIPQANVYYIRRKEASASDVITNSLWFAIALGGALAVACWCGRDWLLTNLLKTAPVSVLPPILALIPFTLFQAYLLGVVQAEQRFKEYNIQQIAPNVLALVGMVVVLVWLRLGLIGAVLTQAAIVVFVTVWLTIRVHRIAKVRVRGNRALAHRMFGFGMKSYVQTLAATLNSRLDQYMIAALLEPKDVGVYAIAVHIAGLLTRIPDATGTVLFPRLAGADPAEASRATAEVCRHTTFAMTVAAIGCGLVGGPAIRWLYGDEFAGAAVPMIVLLMGAVTYSLYLILTRFFTSRSRQQVNIAAAFTALALNVGLNAVLIPRFGILGAAMSSASAYSVSALILLVVFVRESGRGVRDALIIKREDVETARRLVRRLRGSVAA